MKNEEVNNPENYPVEMEENSTILAGDKINNPAELKSLLFENLI